MKVQDVVEIKTIDSKAGRIIQHASGAPRGKLLLTMAVIISLVGIPLLTRAGQTNEEKKLTGNWMGTVTRANPAPGQAPTVLSLVTFFEDGNLLQEGSDPSIRTAGHGTWRRTGHQQFTQSFLNFRFDASRAYLGTRVITSNITLSEDGNQYQADTVVQFFDAAGNLLNTGQGGTEVAQRLH
jgi:hypothetical protein